MTTYTQSRWSLADLFTAQRWPGYAAGFRRIWTAGLLDFETRRSQLTAEIKETDFLDIDPRAGRRSTARRSGFTISPA